ncbi:MAG TPA: type II toxin-antitoxin system VapC family toxin [Tepidisphaeraceae bacterium]|jgi:tRNA(fMet)-specific endonuclease VapC|nr:type II toxin-antitoxin system VapC family toxin [Tepidisphaeraceae bacterium]
MPCLDTTVFIDLAGRSGKKLQARAQAAIRQHRDPIQSHTTTRFNLAELFFGVEGANDPVAERQRMDDLLENVQLLEFEDAATLQFAKIANYLRKIGRPKGSMDVLIAAVATANGEPLLTRNAKDFADIPGLVVIPY